jgi:hypothetical protein
MIVYSEYYDLIGELVEINGYKLVRFSDEKTLFKAYLESRWEIIGDI